MSLAPCNELLDLFVTEHTSQQLPGKLSVTDQSNVGEIRKMAINVHGARARTKFIRQFLFCLSFFSQVHRALLSILLRSVGIFLSGIRLFVSPPPVQITGHSDQFVKSPIFSPT